MIIEIFQQIYVYIYILTKIIQFLYLIIFDQFSVGTCQLSVSSWISAISNLLKPDTYIASGIDIS